MPAWEHHNRKGWNSETYYNYRKFVASKAEGYRGKDQDCADLSMMLLIDFAADNGLMVTFLDNAFRMYMSKAQAAITGSAGKHQFDSDLKWSTKEEFYKIIQRRIGVESLWKRNTIKNEYGPSMGDLLIIWSKDDRHHAALVFKTYGPGIAHPKQQDTSIPDFPGSDTAMSQSNVTEYFKGTVDSDDKTISREPDKTSTHFDYLNSRGNAKRNAELIYFANAKQATDGGFEFRMYNKIVLDNWSDWNGSGMPPFGSHQWP